MDQLQRAYSALVDRNLYWQGVVLLLLGLPALFLRATDARDALLLGGVMLAALAVHGDRPSPLTAFEQYMGLRGGEAAS